MSFNKEKFKFNKKFNRTIFIIFLFILIFALFGSVYAIDSNSSNEDVIRDTSKSVIHNIYSDSTNSEIQSIFDNSKDGDTIRFVNKSYQNISIIVDKSLNILSSKNSIIYTSNKLSERAESLGISNSFGFYFTNTSSGSIINGLSFVGNSDYNVMIEGASNISVINNTISGGKIAGIYVNNSKYDLFENNIMKNSSKDGIIITNTNRSNLISNKIFSNNNIGVKLDNVVLVNLTKNQIYKNGLDGVLLENAKACWILNNTIINNAVSGIRMEGSTIRNHIEYNNISSNVVGIYANSITTNDVITKNTIMYSKASNNTYTTPDNTGSGICFADNYTATKGGTMDFSHNTLGFNEYWDAKSTMTHPSVNIGANWYFDNNGEYSMGHICPMVFGGALSPEDFKHLSMGFSSSGNGLFGQLFDGDKESGAGAFTIDNVNVNGVDYGSVDVGADGKFKLNLKDIPVGSKVTVTINGHSFSVVVKESSEMEDNNINQTNPNPETPKPNVENNSTNSNESSNLVQGNGTGSRSGVNSGSGSGFGNFTGSGIRVGVDSGQSNQGTSDSGDNGAGSASKGISAYEISEEKLSPTSAKNSQLIAVVVVIAVMFIIALGYRRKTDD